MSKERWGFQREVHRKNINNKRERERDQNRVKLTSKPPHTSRRGKWLVLWLTVVGDFKTPQTCLHTLHLWLCVILSHSLWANHNVSQLANRIRHKYWAIRADIRLQKDCGFCLRRPLCRAIAAILGVAQVIWQGIHGDHIHFLKAMRP